MTGKVENSFIHHLKWFIKLFFHADWWWACDVNSVMAQKQTGQGFMTNMTIRGPHKSNDGNVSIFRGPLTCPCIFQESGVLPDTKSWVPVY